MKKHTKGPESLEDQVARYRADIMKDPTFRLQNFRRRVLSAMDDSDKRALVELREEYTDILAWLPHQPETAKHYFVEEFEGVVNAFRFYGLLPPQTEQEKSELKTLLNDVEALEYLEKNYQPGSGREELEVLAEMYHALLARVEKAPKSVREQIHESLKDVVRLLKANDLLP